MVNTPPKMDDIHIIAKRQVTNVVHVTVTAADPIIYTQTATSYSYIPSYSTINDKPTSLPSSLSNNGTNNTKNSSSGLNKTAVIGGAVGGFVVIALIVAVFLFMRRSRKRKGVQQQQQCGYIDDHDPYYQGAGSGMTSSVPAPRHLVAPPEDGQKLFNHNGGYYDDIAAPYNTYPKTAYYSAATSADSLPSFEGPPNYAPFRQIPNQVDNPVTTVTPVVSERHVPHLKEPIQEPPHSRD